MNLYKNEEKRFDYAYSQLLRRSGVRVPYAPQKSYNQALTLMEGIRFV